jgi:hypothetical protein
MLRDARINRIVEGATEVMTAFVSLVGMKGVGEGLESVMKSAKHPVNNFGRLAQFARTQWSDVVIGHELEGLHDKLRQEGKALGELTRSLARAIIRLLGTHREKILDQELIHERIAWSAIELYAMAAVISRLQAKLDRVNGNGHANGNGNGNGHGNGNGNGNGNGHVDRDLVVGRAFCQHAAERIRRRLSDLFDNEDASILRTADAVLGAKT